MSLILTFANLPTTRRIMTFVSPQSTTLRSCLCWTWMDQLSKTDHVLRLYLTAVVFLSAVPEI